MTTEGQKVIRWDINGIKDYWKWKIYWKEVQKNFMKKSYILHIIGQELESLVKGIKE